MSVAPVCPYCRSALQPFPAGVRCTGCRRDYPVVRGIPDLRVAAVPWIGMAEDRAKGLAVDASADPGFPAALREYWAQTPTTSPVDAARHVSHELRAEIRTREWLARLTPGLPGESAPIEQWLDLGCGTASLACAAPDRVEVTGLDIAFRWLIVALRRLADCHSSTTLVCANAEALPFGNGSFQRVIALGTLEHCRELDVVLKEVRRVLQPGGWLHLRTVNRFSLLAEPHVDVWGVGWMPRGWADRYVQWRRGTRYLYHWPRGAGSLRRALRRAGFGDISLEAAAMLPAERERLPRVAVPLLPAYERLRRAAPTARLCALFAPLLEATAMRPSKPAEAGAAIT